MKFASMYCDYIARIDGLFRNDRETARALELDGDKPAEVQAAENMLTLIQAGLRSNRTLSDGVANNLYDAAYNEAVKAADGITGETGSRLVTSADV